MARGSSRRPRVPSGDHASQSEAVHSINTDAAEAAHAAAEGRRGGKTALVLGGGAPNFTLMAGALLAFHRANVKFDLISMAGGGAVLGLTYLAPKGDITSEEALLNTPNIGVSDIIYAAMPINYKVFNKPGHDAEVFRHWFSANPAVRPWLNQHGMTNAQKLYSDQLQMLGAIMCPSNLNIYSKGMCAHAPFIQELVDFNKLAASPIDCVVNAYCIEDQAVVEFEKSELDIHAFRASLSFPFIYPPYRFKGKHYYEGAAYQALNFRDAAARRGIDRIIIFNVMTTQLIRRPRNLWDAYGQSIILPLVANAQNELAMIEHWQTHGHAVANGPATSHLQMTSSGQRWHRPEIYQLHFDIPAEHREFSLDWTRSNLEYLFELGYRQGRSFVQEHERLTGA